MVDEEKGVQAEAEVMQARRSTKIRITRRQLKERVRAYISVNGRLDEGFLDFLGDVFGTISGTFESSLTVDIEKITTAPKRSDGSEVKAVKDLDPETSAYDQVVAAVFIAQLLSYGVESAIQEMTHAKEGVDNPDLWKLPQSETEKEEFTEVVSALINNVTSAYARLIG